MRTVKREGKLEPMIQVKNNLYKRINPDNLCTMVDYAGVLYDATMFLTNENELEKATDGITTNLNESIVEKLSGNVTIGSYIYDLIDAGYTVIDVTCQSEEQIEK